MISQELIYDALFNALSVEAQLLFLRMLAVTDDCGILPGESYELSVLTNPPKKIRANFDGYLGEIRYHGLMTVFEYNGKKFLMFKRDSFDNHQSYLLNKRTRSEYLRMSYEEFVEFSKTFQEVPGNYAPVKQTVESSKQIVESIEQKQKKRFGEFVTLSDSECVKLLGRLGTQARVDRAIEILDNYKGSKGVKYKSDYRTILGWVIERLEGDELKEGAKKGAWKEEFLKRTSGENSG
jgi:hypothetical protein